MKLKHEPDPCATCPYHLGLIKTFVSPCPTCRAGGFRLAKELLGKKGKEPKL